MPPLPDWTGRVRVRFTDPQRYSSFVTITKRALLLAAVALIAAVIAYSLQPREQNHVAMTFEQVGKVANDLAMIKPRLSGTDAKGHPFVVTADKAVQAEVNSHRVRLENVQADIILEKGKKLSVSAAGGLLDADAKTLKLIGAISVYTGDGYELHTDGADVDLAAGRIRSDSVVTGHGPLGSIRADRFTVDRNSEQVHLMGHVRMQFQAHGTKRS